MSEPHKAKANASFALILLSISALQLLLYSYNRGLAASITIGRFEGMDLPQRIAASEVRCVIMQSDAMTIRFGRTDCLRHSPFPFF